MKTIEIKKGWYWSAGYKFGWVPGVHPYGVGIDLNVLKKELANGEKEIKIKISGEEYTLDISDAVSFITKWKSTMGMRAGVRIGVVSKTLLK